MIILSGLDEEQPSYSPEEIAKSNREKRDLYGMPISSKPPKRSPASWLACKSYVASRIYAPTKTEVFLHYLRRFSMNAQLIDDCPVIEKVANLANIDPQDLAKWLELPDVAEKLVKDAKEARTPSRVAQKMAFKLAKTPDGRLRYTAPSYIFKASRKQIFELPGFWDFKTYEAVIDNLAPNLHKRASPESVKEVLEWAQIPLATKEIEVICQDTDINVRQELKEVANFEPLGQDGFWSLKPSS